MNKRSWITTIAVASLMTVSPIVILSCSRLNVPAPTKIETHCGGQQFDAGAFLRVIDSVKDGHLNTQALRIANLRMLLNRDGGAIGYWDGGLELALPIAGTMVAPGDGRLHIRGAAVQDDAPYHHLYFLQPMGKPGIWSWVHYETSASESVCR